MCLPEFREPLCDGLTAGGLRADFAATRLTALSSAVIGDVEAIVAELRGRCAVWFADSGIAANAQRIGLSVDMRYDGQNCEPSVPLPLAPVTPAIDGLGASFAAAWCARPRPCDWSGTRTLQ
jgi:hypothetical protein